MFLDFTGSPVVENVHRNYREGRGGEEGGADCLRLGRRRKGNAGAIEP